MENFKVIPSANVCPVIRLTRKEMPYEPLTIVKDEVQEIIIDVQPTQFEDEEESEEYEVEWRDSLEFYDPYAGSGMNKN
ncbi:hypothetical protein WR25_12685 [Diploscapter pachys]|uniref:Uncharacterized protein n=1 Tax=Diploscapter pachys TaxID=2018661 RepID=A0A2A2J432_9BILA|nr:hypothetical protein WR25_12685 [Diploscapter pachys]